MSSEENEVGISPQSHIRRSNELGQQDRLTEAEREMRLGIDVDPTNVECLAGLTRLLVRQGRVEEAMMTAHRTVELEPRNPHLRAYLGVLRLSSSDPAGAEQDERTAIEFAPDVATFHYNLARAVDRQGRIDEAILAALRAVELDERNAGSRAFLSDLLLRKGDPAAAEQELRAAIEVEPNTGIFHFHLAHALALQGRIDEAIPTLRRGVELDGGSAHGRAHLADLLMQNGMLAEAEQELSAAIAAQPGIAQFHVVLSHVLMRQARLEDAITCAQRATELAPANDEFHHHLEALVAERDRPDAAATTAEATALPEIAPLEPARIDALTAVGAVLAEPAPPRRIAPPPPKRKSRWRSLFDAKSR